MAVEVTDEQPGECLSGAPIFIQTGPIDFISNIIKVGWYKSTWLLVILLEFFWDTLYLYLYLFQYAVEYVYWFVHWPE